MAMPMVKKINTKWQLTQITSCTTLHSSGLQKPMLKVFAMLCYMARQTHYNTNSQWFFFFFTKASTKLKKKLMPANNNKKPDWIGKHSISLCGDLKVYILQCSAWVVLITVHLSLSTLENCSFIFKSASKFEFCKTFFPFYTRFLNFTWSSITYNFV